MIPSEYVFLMAPNQYKLDTHLSTEQRCLNKKQEIHFQVKYFK